MKEKGTILTEAELGKTLERLASEVIERECLDDLVIVGIKTRGVPLAKRLASLIKEKKGVELPVGELDITFYRDDLTLLAEAPVVKGTRIDFPVDGRVVLLVDDVLYTGRTVRAAMNELLDYGRFKALRLLVLVDRGLRELPICPDYVGKRVETRPGEVVEVRLREVDGKDEVVLLERL